LSLGMVLSNTHAAETPHAESFFAKRSQSRFRRGQSAHAACLVFWLTTSDRRGRSGIKKCPNEQKRHPAHREVSSRSRRNRRISRWRGSVRRPGNRSSRDGSP